MENEIFLREFDLTAPDAASLYDETRGHGFVTDQNTAAQPRLQVLELNSGFAPAWWYAGGEVTRVVSSPEGCHAAPGADLRPEDLQDRRLPLTYKVKVPAAGSYQVTVTLAALPGQPENGDPMALLFLGRRRLCWRGSVTAETPFSGSFVADVSPIVPRGQETSAEDDSVDVTLVGQGICLKQLRVEASSCQTIYIMGDSTVTDQSADVPYAPGASYSGWGQMLPVYLPGYNVSNHAHSGLTTETFRTEGHYDTMRRLVKPGDICLMQFAHNDQKLAHLQADGGYTERLTQYIDELRAMGAAPVLVTPLARNSWNAASQYNDLLAAYAEACLTLGKKMGVPVIDLHAKAMAELIRVGMEAAKVWFFPGDYTHTNDFGACKMAAYVAEGLLNTALLRDHGSNTAQTPANRDGWQPCPPFAALTPPADTTLTPPEGGAVPFADFDTTRPDDKLTRVETLDLTIRAMHFFPINVYNDLYADVVGHETYAGTVQCAAQNGLIPPVFVADGKLYPERPVTLAEFLMVFIPGYCSRRALSGAEATLPKKAALPPEAAPAVGKAVAAGLLPADSEWNSPITRRWAAAFCRSLKT